MMPRRATPPPPPVAPPVSLRRPRVLNKRTATADELRDAIYVGRPSIFGNPFTHLGPPSGAAIRVATRAEAIRRYAEHLQASPELLAEAKRVLRGKDLVCWCAPLPCHAEVLLVVANAPEPAGEGR